MMEFDLEVLFFFSASVQRPASDVQHQASSVRQRWSRETGPTLSQYQQNKFLARLDDNDRSLHNQDPSKQDSSYDNYSLDNTMAQPRPTTLNFITGNANKLAEVQAILAGVDGLTLQSRNVEGAEIQGSIEEVARDKCSRAAVAVSSGFRSRG